MFLLIRSEDKQAQVMLYQSHELVSEHSWEAHRSLSDTLLLVIKDELAKQNKTFQDISGVGVYAGPGSFTGLRISHAVANSLSYGLDIPAVNSTGDDWAKDCVKRLMDNPKSRNIVTPEYGREARITKQRK
ncbi:MAG: hypothetical protein AAF413_04190 [Patescibacteria group bacterium]